jgi:lantibiotic leader peptide-processing serine protease
MQRWLIGSFGSMIGAPLLAGGAISGTSGSAETYIVLYKQLSVESDAATTIQKVGGTLVYAYSQIGVAIARSESTSFRSNLLNNSKIENVSATTGYGYQLPAQSEAEGPPAGDLPNAPVTDTNSLSPLQWDMRQIHAPEAHAITCGSPAVPWTWRTA